ncbi:uncharacterized protein K452DRAFT_292931 [Aplosporella prunicola CBS 121167]|uniref:Uncharacterized protein n=1 Tax=Aplosporella prunicola CBS 121167 TaxID=1176127 RepID=A0A6A6AXB6_9PEZI|nr:uncharacterized protein K452DRAFT_292931 [Aplosporella prunicola CBS 121167]KAF2135823.1 hypothetical protein K452DRAFT_292931 [Aplosporella prunicola CBS 121167]
MDEEFYIGLNPTGDEGSSYRLLNDPAAPYQRKNVTERKGAVDVRCSLEDVIHGLPDPDNERYFASLIILKFTFDSRRTGRRIKAANISLQFAAMEDGGNDPEVTKIAPDGSFNLVETTHQVAEKRSTGLNIGAPPFAGAKASVDFGWERSTSREAKNATKVVGSIDTRGNTYGQSDTASWTLMENSTTKDGVPSKMRAAILLRRRDEKPFQCFFEIHATTDFKSSIEKLFGSRTRDDPIWFKPELEPTNSLQEYDDTALDSVDIEKLSGVTFATILDDAIRHI